MTNDLGKVDCVENCNQRQEVYGRLQGLEQERRRVHTPEGLEALEREIRGYTDQLCALLLEMHLQASLDSEEQQEKEEELIRSWPGRLRSDGYERVRIFTLGGFWITVRVRYSCRACDRRSGKRYKGVYGGLVLLGIHEHCTPALRGDRECVVGVAELVCGSAAGVGGAGCETGRQGGAESGLPVAARQPLALGSPMVAGSGSRFVTKAQVVGSCSA